MKKENPQTSRKTLFLLLWLVVAESKKPARTESLGDYPFWGEETYNPFGVPAPVQK